MIAGGKAPVWNRARVRVGSSREEGAGAEPGWVSGWSRRGWWWEVNLADGEPDYEPDDLADGDPHHQPDR